MCVWKEGEGEKWRIELFDVVHFFSSWPLFISKYEDTKKEQKIVLGAKLTSVIKYPLS